LIPRLTSMIYPMPLLLLPLAFFHRFDPARLKASFQRSRRNLLLRLNDLLKPLSVWIFTRSRTRSSEARGDRPRVSILRSIVQESFLSFQIYPLAIVLSNATIVLTAVVPVKELQSGVLPAIFAVITIFLADGATREGRFGTTGLIFSSPRLQAGY